MTTAINHTPASGTDSTRVGTLLEKAISDIGIPPCPAILNQINAEMRKDEPDFKRLANIINSDVGIAASLITITNSPFFGLRNRVRSVNEALIMLGLSVASRAIAGLVLRKLFPVTPIMEQFWHASASIARLSGWLAQQDHSGIKVRPDDAYTFGLFRDCGIPLLLNRFKNYSEVMQKANEEKELSFTDVENELCNINHALVGGLLAQGWWLPDEICLAIRHHHDYLRIKQGSSTNLPAATLGLIATAQIAEYLFQRHTGLGQTQEWHKMGPACLHLLGLTDADMERLYDESTEIIESKE